MARIKPEFDRRGGIIGSRSMTGDHEGGATSERRRAGPNYPIIGDADSPCRSSTGCSRPTWRHPGRTPADNQTVRNVFVVGPDKKVKLILIYR
jgi:alkyl hydroperoxide reductase subunit AhpC